VSASRSSRPPRSKRSGAKRAKASFRGKAGLIVAVVLALVALVALTMPYRRKTGTGHAVDVEVPSGASDTEVVARLHAAGVVEDPRLFSLMLKVIGGAKAQPGRHFFADDLSPAEVIRRLRRSGGAMHVRVTIPEGWNRFDIARRLRERRACDDAEFLRATTDAKLLDELHLSQTAEGWLFPATYDLPIDGDAREVVRKMVAETQSRLERLTRSHSPPANMTIHDVIVLASVVEKEAAVDDERPLIASAFYNRMREPEATGGKLQADPTAMYGCLVMPKPTTPCIGWLATGGKPSAEIQHDPGNPWSTYTHAGLPPTPIGNPGEKSIEAVLAPATTRYFYFVAKGGGRHTFSETLAEHNQAVKQSP
jgi:UPF0755 protein